MHDELFSLLEDLNGVRQSPRYHPEGDKDPRGARRRFSGVPAMRDLELLRRWDLGGRSPAARTLSLEESFDILFTGEAGLLDLDDGAGATFDPFEVGS